MRHSAVFLFILYAGGAGGDYGAEPVGAEDGKAKAIRFSTLERLCEVLECEPGDLLAYEKGSTSDVETVEDGQIT